MRCARVALVAAGISCGPVEPQQVARLQSERDDARLHQVQGPASHNTYEASHTPPGENIAWHFVASAANPVAIRHIEIDLREALQTPPSRLPAGDWWVAHNFEEPATAHCTGVGLLSDCLRNIADWHRAHPRHPLATIWVDKKEDWSPALGRGPADLDAALGRHFAADEVFRPREMAFGSRTARQNAERGEWPTHGDVAGKVMFVLTAGATRNARLHDYVATRGDQAWAFVAPHEAASNGRDTSIEPVPTGFDPTTARWVAIYNFPWCSSDDDQMCDSAWCYLLDEAAAANYLTRVWDLDDGAERARAMSAGANVLPVNCPWLAGGSQFCDRNDRCQEDP